MTIAKDSPWADLASQILDIDEQAALLQRRRAILGGEFERMLPQYLAATADVGIQVDLGCGVLLEDAIHFPRLRLRFHAVDVDRDMVIFQHDCGGHDSEMRGYYESLEVPMTFFVSPDGWRLMHALGGGGQRDD